MAKYPLLVERYTLRPDSGGAGRFRGGLGTEQVVQAINQINFSSQMDRVKCKPWGLFDGHSGEGNSVAISRGGAEKETHFPNGKALNQVLKPGDAYILRSGGGGGYGSPLERDLDRLARDVRTPPSLLPPTVMPATPFVVAGWRDGWRSSRSRCATKCRKSSRTKNAWCLP